MKRKLNVIYSKTAVNGKTTSIAERKLSKESESGDQWLSVDWTADGITD